MQDPWLQLRGFSVADSVAEAHVLTCPMACGILVPQPGIKPTSPALQGRFLTAEPLGKSLGWVFYLLQPTKCGRSDAILILDPAFKRPATSAFPLRASFQKRSPGNSDTLRPLCYERLWIYHTPGPEGRMNGESITFWVDELHGRASRPVQPYEWPQLKPTESRTGQLIPLNPQNYGK